MATNKINVTAVDFSTSGNIDNGSTTSVWAPGSWPTGWNGINTTIFTPYCILLLGNCAFGTYTNIIYKCTDMTGVATWNPVTLPVSANWSTGAYNGNTIVLVGWQSTTNTTVTVYSTDAGANWNTGTTFTSTQLWGDVVYGNKFIIVINSTTLKTSTDGINWTNLTGTLPAVPASGKVTLVFNSVIDRWFFWTGSTFAYMSTTNAASAWTDISTNIGKVTGPVTYYIEKLISTGNYIVAGLRSDYPIYVSWIKISTNGTTWTTIGTLSSNTGLAQATEFYDFANGTLMIGNTGATGKLSSLVGTSFTYDTGFTSSLSSFNSGNLGTNNLQTYPLSNWILFWNYTTLSMVKKPINIGKLSADRYIDVTASKTGATSVIKRLFIKKMQQNTNVYTLLANPGSFALAATSNGVVDPSAFTTATSNLTVTKNGVDQTGWTFTTSNDTGLTASITGSVLSITALSNSVDLAYANLAASKTGEPSQLLKVAVSKNKSGTPSGYTLGGSISTISTNSSSTVGIKFLATGALQVKYGTGAYTTILAWSSPINSISPPGGSWWLRMTVTGEPLTTGTTGTWLPLSTDREFTLTKTTPSGTYTSNLVVEFGTTSTGGNINVGTTALQVIVP